MENTKEVREELSKLLNDLKNGEIEANKAEAMNDAFGGIIDTFKLELEYSALRKEKPNIDCDASELKQAEEIHTAINDYLAKY
jgi:hypothetical protein